MAKSVLPVYFFPGPETGQKKKKIEKVLESIKAADGQEPEMHRFYPYDTKADEIISILRNGSLFSSRRVVIVADAHSLKKADLQLFKKYIKSPSKEAVLIFTTDEGPGSREYPRTLANALPKNAVEVFWEMFERDKRGWIMRFFREKGLKIHPAAVDLLIDLTEGTTDALKEACGHLVFSSNSAAGGAAADSAAEGYTAGSSGLITEENVDAVLEHSREETVYSLFDRFCKRDLPGVLDAYRKIIHSDPAMADRIAGLLVTPLMALRDFKMLVSRGMPEDQAAKELELRGGKRALRSYRNGAGAFSLSELDTALNRLIDLTAWLRSSPRELSRTKTEFWMCSTLSGRK